MSFTDIDSSSSTPGYFGGSSYDHTPAPSFGPPGGGTMSAQDSAELQQFFMIEQEKAKMRAQIQLMTDLCWEKCIDKPPSKLDSKTESCFNNCAHRFFDVSLLITQRFANMLKRQGNY